MLEITDLRTTLIGPVSLSIGAGEIVAVMGASGAGKSLLLRAIVDLDPNEGRVRLGDTQRERVPADRWRRLVAMVPAESGWWADRVGEHFRAGDTPRPVLEAMGLPEALDWEVARLSSGERHRIAIVRALCGAPGALLLDEPTAALDDAATAAVEALIRAEAERGACVLLVTHDRAQAERLAQRRFHLAAGRLQAEGEGVA